MRFFESRYWQVLCQSVLRLCPSGGGEDASFVPIFQLQSLGSHVVLANNAGVGNSHLNRDCAICCLLYLSSCNEGDRSLHKDNGNFHRRS